MGEVCDQPEIGSTITESPVETLWLHQIISGHQLGLLWSLLGTLVRVVQRSNTCPGRGDGVQGGPRPHQAHQLQEEEGLPQGRLAQEGDEASGGGRDGERGGVGGGCRG